MMKTCRCIQGGGGDSKLVSCIHISTVYFLFLKIFSKKKNENMIKVYNGGFIDVISE